VSFRKDAKGAKKGPKVIGGRNPIRSAIFRQTRRKAKSRKLSAEKEKKWH
jgi:hypothetical protein